jgi:hypothetical protein
MKLPKRLWGGFCDNKLDIREMDTGFGGFGSGDGMRRLPAIFTSRKEARKEYEDVRPIEIWLKYRETRGHGPTVSDTL